MDGRCRWLGATIDAEPLGLLLAWRGEGARLTSLLRVGGRELERELKGTSELDVYGRDLEEKELVLLDCAAEDAGDEEEIDEDAEENDTDKRCSHRREVDGRET